MGFFNKMMETLGLVDVVDDDEYEDETWGAEPQQQPADPFSFAKAPADDSFAGEQIQKPKRPMFNDLNNPIGREKIKTYTAKGADQIKMIVIRPETYEEAQDICDYIRAGKPVVVNLEGMQFDVSQRVMDFLSGSCYSLNGNIQRVAKNIFIVAPNNIDVSAEMNRSTAAKTSNLPWMQQQAKPGMNDFDYRG